MSLHRSFVIGGSLWITENVNLVYLDAPQNRRQLAEPLDLARPLVYRTVTLDPTLLFRFSALTFTNGDRGRADPTYGWFG